MMTKEEILKKVAAELSAKTSTQILDEVMEIIRAKSGLHSASADNFKLSTDPNSLIDISITFDYINMIAEHGGNADDYIDMMMGYAGKEVNT